MPGKPFDRLQFAVEPDKLVDLFRPHLGCGRRNSLTHLCRAVLRFRTELHIRKRFSSYAIFGIGLQEPHRRGVPSCSDARVIPADDS